ncbi:MAG TPA: hypothetical protein VKB00_05865, partial [Candidatus Limnocylindrales bacterium]|nr:hypothetical protein [Candidatus Limnocylindrales bacterium]
MATVLKTPRSWPRILLGRRGTDPKALAADPSAALDAAVAAGAFDGLRRAVHDLGPTGTIATITA